MNDFPCCRYKQQMLAQMQQQQAAQRQQQAAQQQQQQFTGNYVAQQQQRLPGIRSYPQGGGFPTAPGGQNNQAFANQAGPQGNNFAAPNQSPGKNELFN